MKTIFKDKEKEITIVLIFEYDHRVYCRYRVFNNTTRDILTSINSILWSDIPFRYFSHEGGVYSYVGTLPYEPTTQYCIPSGCFIEFDSVFDAPSINKGDSFDLKISSCPRFHFECFGDYWEVTTTPSYKSQHDELFEANKDLRVTLTYVPNNDSSNDGIQNPIDVLESLIGLSEVKTEVKSLANYVRINQLRKSKGLKQPAISYHCVFTGNPGTGKTTIARIVASIYKELGVLKKGHLVETDRSGLVGQYVGHTAPKTNEIIDSALDGVLFIDEAYSLSSYERKNDFGQEAISTLLKRMEDDRDRLVVIVAGYTAEMEDFIKSNPGLKSRFVNYIHFPDYSSRELFDIFIFEAQKNGFMVDEAAKLELKTALDAVVSKHDRDFGNGRFVRTLFLFFLRAQADRLSSIVEISDNDLSLLTRNDILEALSHNRVYSRYRDN